MHKVFVFFGEQIFIKINLSAYIYLLNAQKLPGDYLAEEKRHYLVPEHILIKKEKVEELMSELGITKKSLPKISKLDAAVKPLKADKGDIVKIIRDSLTAGKTTYYRRVV